ncbi:hypothetical protein Q3G72_016753 [Acer saccharum]|nr:hypothetical protein Q3G72_016753 [Acer saccharum]
MDSLIYSSIDEIALTADVNQPLCKSHRSALFQLADRNLLICMSSSHASLCSASKRIKKWSKSCSVKSDGLEKLSNSDTKPELHISSLKSLKTRSGFATLCAYTEDTNAIWCMIKLVSDEMTLLVISVNN